MIHKLHNAEESQRAPDTLTPLMLTSTILSQEASLVRFQFGYKIIENMLM
jgi:hypothetical protein